MPIEEYSRWNIPDHLLTRKQLATMGLKPAKGQTPVAIATWGGVLRKNTVFLFDKALAVPKPPPSPARCAAIKKPQPHEGLTVLNAPANTVVP